MLIFSQKVITKTENHPYHLKNRPEPMQLLYLSGNYYDSKSHLAELLIGSMNTSLKPYFYKRVL